MINLIFLLSGSVGGSFVVVDVSIFVVYLVWGLFSWCFLGGGEGLWGFLIGLGVYLFWCLFNTSVFAVLNKGHLHAAQVVYHELRSSEIRCTWKIRPMYKRFQIFTMRLQNQTKYSYK